MKTKSLFLSLIMSIGVFVGCQNLKVHPSSSIFSENHSLSVVNESTEILVKMPKSVYEKKGDAVFWSLALEKGMTKLNRMILNKHVIVIPTDIGLASDVNFVQKKGKVVPVYNSYAQEYAQAFKVQVKLVPDISMAGQIIALKKDSYVVAEKEFCYLGIFKMDVPYEKNVFFLIGKKEPTENFVKIIGMGKVMQFFSNTQVVSSSKKENNKFKLLANAQIDEVSEEVEKGDLIFFPKITVSVLDNDQYIDQTEIKPEVIVQPKTLKKPSLPKESK